MSTVLAPTLTVDLLTETLELRPGTGKAIRIRSFTTAGKDYAMSVHLGHEGQIVVLCRCPSALRVRQCKHVVAMHDLIRTQHPVTVNAWMTHQPTVDATRTVPVGDDTFAGL